MSGFFVFIYMMQGSAVPPLRLVFLMWAVFTVESTLGADFGFLGVLPRTASGLIGIVTAPLVHGNLNHLISNTIPLLALGGTIYFFYPKVASRVFFHSYFFTNALVWIFARSFYHIGASGVVYAFASFLICYGFFNRNFKTVLISIIVIAIYGSLVFGVFTLNAGVSWESHLMGAIVGGVTAFLFKDKD